ncbi:hypothetical protein OJAV_G00123530 [Oryzias javanicus]|uniref:DENR N-terminal domain-containing protein n=1 Tax=Oryzias javanicus TaxID=123683 RepID=A0A437CT93_ORYJA|nr:hypothetical protein OJAV_G00123530 [Oryzias javanicus]
MATTEMEPGSEQGTADPDSKYPLKVLYCGVCSLPTEYCEYMPEPAKCRQWLEKNFPDVFARMTVAKAPKQESGTGEAPPAAEEEEKKKQKRGGRGQIKQKKEDGASESHNSKNPQSQEEIRDAGLRPGDVRHRP